MPANTIQTTGIVFLAIVAAVSVLWFAQSLFAPILAALVLGVVCAPATDKIEGVGLPRVISALLVLATLLISLLTIFFFVEPTVSSALRRGPLIWREVTEFLEDLRGALSGFDQFKESVSDALSENGQRGDGEQPEEEAPVAVPGVMEALALAPSVAAAIMVFVGTLYFFLIARRDVYRHFGTLSRGLTPELLCAAEARVSRYFVAVTVINAIFGLLVAFAMTAIGMANPMLWGLAAFLMNFVLYLGPAAFALALVIGGVVQFEGPYSFLPAAAYISMNMVEGQFVTPSLVGRHMHVNPLLVFISLVFWLWLWGPIGGVVAIPLLVWSIFVGEQLFGGKRSEGRIAPLSEQAEEEKNSELHEAV